MNSPQDRLGEIVIGHRLERDTLLLFGWSGESIPSHGLAVPKRAAGRGRFAAASWFDGEDRRHWFLIVIHAPQAGSCQTGDSFQLHGSGTGASTVAYCPAAMVDADAFTGELHARLGAQAEDAVGFLMTIFSVTAASTPEPVRALISAALSGATEECGVVEMLGRIDSQSLLLQGWMRDPQNTEPRLLIDNGGLREYGVAFASFARPDVAAPATGFAAIVQVSDGVQAMPRQIYVKSGTRYRRLTLVPNAIQLRDEDVPPHVASLMGSLRADGTSLKQFNTAARPRFTGQDTVSTLPVPVRMAVDLTARVPGAGWYVTGWLLDPLKLVTSVTLRGPGGLALRLNGDWTRLPREDVSNGFRADPLFAGRISDDLHGFNVFAAAGTEENAVWIELEISGRGTAFMPVSLTPVETLDDRKRLLLSVDLHKASATDIIERQLGPLFHARNNARRKARGHRVVRAGSGGGEAVLIVPLVEEGIKSKVVVSHLAGSRPPSGLRIVFVCSPSLGDVVARLPHDLDFYGLPADILVAADPVDRCEALEIGVEASDESRIVFLAPQVHGVSRDWLADLIATLGDGTAPLSVSPTLLYEDGSVRYAGIDAVEFFEAAPYGTAVCARAGYPRGAVAQGAGGPTLAGAIDCCAMTRAAFETVGGFSVAYALDRFKGTDLFLRLRAAGVPLTWAGGIELYALDDLQANSQYSAVVGALVDGWAFKAAWQAGLSAQNQRAETGGAVPLRPPISLPNVLRQRVRPAAVVGRVG